MATHPQYMGQKAEEYFSSRLHEAKLDYEFKNKWYDYLVNEQKVELKSCQLTTRNRFSKKSNRTDINGWQIGKFDFANKDNREKQIKENIWIALVIRHDDQFIMYGVLRAKKLSGRRYLSIHQARELKPLTFEDRVEEIGKP